jgi:tetrahydromethanopterin S-methyltransferase subunit F
MCRTLVVLLILVNSLFAQTQTAARDRFLSNGVGVSRIACLLNSETRSPPDGMNMVTPHYDAMQNWVYGSSTLAEDRFRPSNVQQTGTARFIVGMVAVAVVVQHFVHEYSSLDSGGNSYSQPAVDIRPDISRGSVRVSVQLRF